MEPLIDELLKSIDFLIENVEISNDERLKLQNHMLRSKSIVLKNQQVKNQIFFNPRFFIFSLFVTQFFKIYKKKLQIEKYFGHKFLLKYEIPATSLMTLIGDNNTSTSNASNNNLQTNASNTQM